MLRDTEDVGSNGSLLHRPCHVPPRPSRIVLGVGQHVRRGRRGDPRTCPPYASTASVKMAIDWPALLAWPGLRGSPASTPAHAARPAQPALLAASPHVANLRSLTSSQASEADVAQALAASPSPCRPCAALPDAKNRPGAGPSRPPGSGRGPSRSGVPDVEDNALGPAGIVALARSCRPARLRELAIRMRAGTDVARASASGACPFSARSPPLAVAGRPRMTALAVVPLSELRDLTIEHAECASCAGLLPRPSHPAGRLKSRPPRRPEPAGTAALPSLRPDVSRLRHAAAGGRPPRPGGGGAVAS